MKQKIKTVIFFFANPRLLLCLALAWLITNGWSYILLGIGTWLDIGWMTVVAGAYLTFLWLPISPEKLVTIVLAIVLLRILFPRDEKTLAVLRGMYEGTKGAVRRKKQSRAEKKRQKHEASETQNE
ncbi:MAG: hypothetical protein IKB75_01075 [Clostridia bacterium]|nr:hypothetical protein [Clostridia bacterium]